MSGPRFYSLNLFIIAVVILASDGTGTELHPPEDLPLSVPLGWSGKNSRLPLEQRGSTVPIIPDGHRRFLFYLYGPTGQLVPRWLNLQQVQNFLLSMDPKAELGDFMKAGDFGIISETSTLANQDRPKDTVQQVIASVQQVISNEVAHSQGHPDTPTFVGNSTDQSINIPEVILQNLMVLQQHTTPWYAPVTNPSTFPTETEPTTLPSTSRTETATEVATESISDYELVADVSTTTEESLDAMDKIPEVLRPLVDRWNSRFPSWSSLGPPQIGGITEKTNEIETTDDYHVIPPSISETVIPSDNEVMPGGSHTTPWIHDEETTSNSDSKLPVTIQTPQNLITDVTTGLDPISTKMPTKTSISPMMNSTTNEIINEFYQTTLHNLYGELESSGNQIMQGNPTFTSMQVESSPLPILEETTTLSPHQATIVDMTDKFEHFSEKEYATKPSVSQEIPLNTMKDQDHHLAYEGTTSSLQVANQHLLAVNEVSEIVPIQIRDPLLPESIYDIQPINETTTTPALPTEKPQSPYDTPTTFLTVIDTSDVAAYTIRPDESTSSKPQNLLDAMQGQDGDHVNVKPHYDFPVKVIEAQAEPVEEMQTKPSMEVFAEFSSNENNQDIHTTVQELLTEMYSSPEVTTMNYNTENETDAFSDTVVTMRIYEHEQHPNFFNVGGVTSPAYDMETTNRFNSAEETEQTPNTENPILYVTVTPEANSDDLTTKSSYFESLSTSTIHHSINNDINVSHETQTTSSSTQNFHMTEPMSQMITQPSKDEQSMSHPSATTSTIQSVHITETIPQTHIDHLLPGQLQHEISSHTSVGEQTSSNKPTAETHSSTQATQTSTTEQISTNGQKIHNEHISTSELTLPAEQTMTTGQTPPTVEIQSSSQLQTTEQTLPPRVPPSIEQVSSTEAALSIDEAPQAPELSQSALLPDYIYHYYDGDYIHHHNNVIQPSQLANNDNQSRIDLEALQSDANHTDGDYFYDYIGQPVYLDDVPKEYYDYDVTPESQHPTNVTDDLDFPGPNATSPYHEHHHGDHHGDHHGPGDHHGHHGDHHGGHHKDPSSTGNPAQLIEVPADNLGLEVTVENLEPDIRKFVDVINDITFKVYKQAARQYRRRNFVMSPLSLISTLNILLLGARGSTSAALSDLLLSDQFYTFNPHLVLKNVTDSVLQMADTHDVAFYKQFLVEQQSNQYPIDFFSRTIDYFYGAKATELEPKLFDNDVRKTVNEVIANATRGSVLDFLTEEPLKLRPPLSAVSTNFFHGRWNSAVTEDDLFDMNFIRFPTAERRLIRTVGLKKKMTLNAGYSKDVGVTTAEVPYFSQHGELSLVVVMPGEQKNFVANGLTQVESAMTSEKWSKILRSMSPNTVMFKMPVFRHRSFHNFSGILSDLGLGQLFKSSEADFSGINTVKNLHLSDVVQLTEFQSCQVEEARPVNAMASRKVKRSPVQQPFWPRQSQSVKKDDVLLTGQYSPTFIYGIPMTEYLKKNVENLTPQEPVDGEGYYENASPDIMRLKPLATVPHQRVTSEHSSSSTKLSHTTQDVGESLQGENDNKDGADHSLEESAKSSPVIFSPEENPLPIAAPGADYNYNYYDYGEPNDYRINRMGVPLGEYEDSFYFDTTPQPPAGAFYRADGGGVLAFDRAFMYAIRHNPTGLLLYVGRYIDPEGN